MLSIDFYHRELCLFTQGLSVFGFRYKRGLTFYEGFLLLGLGINEASLFKLEKKKNPTKTHILNFLIGRS